MRLQVDERNSEQLGLSLGREGERMDKACAADEKQQRQSL
jgi:hypothetical protein